MTAGWETDFLQPSNLGPGDCFGRSLALDQQGSLLVVGTPHDDHMGAGVRPIGSGTESNTKSQWSGLLALAPPICSSVTAPGAGQQLAIEAFFTSRHPTRSSWPASDPVWRSVRDG